MKLLRILPLLLFSAHLSVVGCSAAKFGGEKAKKKSPAVVTPPAPCNADEKTCPPEPGNEQPPSGTPPQPPMPDPKNPQQCEEEFKKCTDDACKILWQNCGGNPLGPDGDRPSQNNPNQSR